MKSKNVVLLVVLLFIILIIIAGVIATVRDNENKKYLTENKSYVDSVTALSKTINTQPKFWEISNFVDDFGDATKDKYIQTTTEGVFSNSATLNSFLGVKILVTKRNIGLFMHEYGYTNPATYFIDVGYINMKNSDGVVVKGYTGDKWNNSGGIKISGNTYQKIKNFLLKSKGEIKVNVQDEYSSTYAFIINADGFAEKYKEL